MRLSRRGRPLAIIFRRTYEICKQKLPEVNSTLCYLERFTNQIMIYISAEAKELDWSHLYVATESGFRVVSLNTYIQVQRRKHWGEANLNGSWLCLAPSKQPPGGLESSSGTASPAAFPTPHPSPHQTLSAWCPQARLVFCSETDKLISTVGKSLLIITPSCQLNISIHKQCSYRHHA